MLVCACKEAKEDCATTCERWATNCRPDRVYVMPTWPKQSFAGTLIKAAIDYANKLDW